MNETMLDRSNPHPETSLHWTYDDALFLADLLAEEEQDLSPDETRDFLPILILAEDEPED